MIVASDLQGQFQLDFVVDLDEHIETDARRQLVEFQQLAVSSAAAINSTQSAPMIRVSSTSRSLTVKSLRSTGSEHAVARRLQVVDRSAEVWAVGQHREAARAARTRRPAQRTAGSRSANKVALRR